MESLKEEKQTVVETAPQKVEEKEQLPPYSKIITQAKKEGSWNDFVIDTDARGINVGDLVCFNSSSNMEKFVKYDSSHIFTNNLEDETKLNHYPSDPHVIKGWIKG